MAVGIESQSYLDKVFQRPDFIIWEDGVCNIQAVQESVSHLTERLTEIIPAVEADRIIPQIERSESIVRSEVTPSRSALIPMSSDVWNGLEPINYVSLHIFAHCN